MLDFPEEIPAGFPQLQVIDDLEEYSPPANEYTVFPDLVLPALTAASPLKN